MKWTLCTFQNQSTCFMDCNMTYADDYGQAVTINLARQLKPGVFYMETIGTEAEDGMVLLDRRGPTMIVVNNGTILWADQLFRPRTILKSNLEGIEVTGKVKKKTRKRRIFF